MNLTENHKYLVETGPKLSTHIIGIDDVFFFIDNWYF